MKKKTTIEITVSDLFTILSEKGFLISEDAIKEVTMDQSTLSVIIIAETKSESEIAQEKLTDKQKKFLSQSIEDLGVSVRLANIFKAGGIKEPKDILALTKTSYLKIGGTGRMSWEELNDLLRANDFSPLPES